uniref:basic salivary proline-rich protein 2-like n=1 Tax=Nyctereutes procyonoides TaxID=34880 RepID=UPI00244481A8|nr:basic salivary proline-rich protein 2-like [Nyctereutes procyonoides]
MSAGHRHEESPCVPAPRKLIPQQAATEEPQSSLQLADGIFVRAACTEPRVLGAEMPARPPAPSPSPIRAQPPGLARAAPPPGSGCTAPPPGGRGLARSLRGSPPPGAHPHNGLTRFPRTSPPTGSPSPQLEQESGGRPRRGQRPAEPAPRAGSHARSRGPDKQSSLGGRRRERHPCAPPPPHPHPSLRGAQRKPAPGFSEPPCPPSPSGARGHAPSIAPRRSPPPRPLHPRRPRPGAARGAAQTWGPGGERRPRREEAGEGESGRTTMKELNRAFKSETSGEQGAGSLPQTRRCVREPAAAVPAGSDSRVQQNVQLVLWKKRREVGFYGSVYNWLLG